MQISSHATLYLRPSSCPCTNLHKDNNLLNKNSWQKEKMRTNLWQIFQIEGKAEDNIREVFCMKVSLLGALELKKFPLQCFGRDAKTL